MVHICCIINPLNLSRSIDHNHNVVQEMFTDGVTVRTIPIPTRPCNLHDDYTHACHLARARARRIWTVQCTGTLMCFDP